MIKIAICGASGRMGHAVYKTLLSDDEFEIVFGVDGYIADDLPFPMFYTFEEVDKNLKADIIIDFSKPESLNSLLDYAVKTNNKIVLATTGYSEEQNKMIDDACKQISIFQASNLSLGVNLLSNLGKEAAKFLGGDYDVEIVETHHNLKVDSPSGTALTLAQSIESVREELFETFGRHHKCERRKPNEIGIHAVRGGTVVGKHDIHFFGKGEVVTLSHESENKEMLARGALRAAKFLIGKPAGMFDMNSIIGDFYAVTTVNLEKDVTLIAVEKTSIANVTNLFEAVADKNINVDMISQTINSDGSVSVSFTLFDKDSKKADDLLSKFKIDYTKHSTNAKLTVEGAGMEHKSGVALDVLKVLSQNEVEISSITTSETKISCCIKAEKSKLAEKALKEFFNI